MAGLLIPQSEACGLTRCAECAGMFSPQRCECVNVERAGDRGLRFRRRQHLRLAGSAVGAVAARLGSNLTKMADQKVGLAAIVGN